MSGAWVDFHAATPWWPSQYHNGQWHRDGSRQDSRGKDRGRQWGDSGRWNSYGKDSRDGRNRSKTPRGAHAHRQRPQPFDDRWQPQERYESTHGWRPQQQGPHDVLGSDLIKARRLAKKRVNALASAEQREQAVARQVTAAEAYLREVQVRADSARADTALRRAALEEAQEAEAVAAKQVQDRSLGLPTGDDMDEDQREGADSLETVMTKFAGTTNPELIEILAAIAAGRVKHEPLSQRATQPDSDLDVCGMAATVEAYRNLVAALQAARLQEDPNVQSSMLQSAILQHIPHAPRADAKESGQGSSKGVGKASTPPPKASPYEA